MGQIKVLLIDVNDEEMKALRDALDLLDNNFGITASVGTTERGEVMALNENLRDLRKLVFESDWVEIQRGAPIEKGD